MLSPKWNGNKTISKPKSVTLRMRLRTNHSWFTVVSVDALLGNCTRNHMVYISVNQKWANYGPWTRYDPFGILIWPAKHWYTVKTDVISDGATR